jgi:hypothetical protein
MEKIKKTLLESCFWRGMGSDPNLVFGVERAVDIIMKRVKTEGKKVFLIGCVL